MVGEEAAPDAVMRARRLPSLKVGLHLVVARGKPVLSPAQIPHLVGPDGRFSAALVWTGIRIFFGRAARAELAREIAAQFEAFRATGLTLDHVNAHNHMHLHPTVLSLILKIGPRYGLKAVRVPHEPFLPSFRAARRGLVARFATSALLLPWLALMRYRLRRAGLACNDYVFGLNDTGRMGLEAVTGVLENLPPGVSEIYLHPATFAWPGRDPGMAGYRCEDELAALVHPAVSEIVRRSGVECIGFCDLAAA